MTDAAGHQGEHDGRRSAGDRRAQPVRRRTRRSDEFNGTSLDTTRWTVAAQRERQSASTNGQPRVCRSYNGSMLPRRHAAHSNIITRPTPSGDRAAAAKRRPGRGLTETQAGLRCASTTTTGRRVHMISAGGQPPVRVHLMRPPGRQRSSGGPTTPAPLPTTAPTTCCDAGIHSDGTNLDVLPFDDEANARPTSAGRRR